MAEQPFTPSRLVFRNSGADLVLAAEDDEGRYAGIIVPADVRPLLEEMLPTSGPRFFDIWSSYAADRGGDVFFAELSELLLLIQRHPQLRILRKLTGFRHSDQVFHDVVVGKVVVLAEGLSRNPEVVPASSLTRTPDLRVDGPTGRMAVEVKAVTRLAGQDGGRIRQWRCWFGIPGIHGTHVDPRMEYKVDTDRARPGEGRRSQSSMTLSPQAAIARVQRVGSVRMIGEAHQPPGGCFA